MYTADNILGLKVTHRSNKDKLDNPGVVYTITETGVDFFHGHDLNNPQKSGYTLKGMAQFLNEGSWILIPSPVTNSFPIY